MNLRVLIGILMEMVLMICMLSTYKELIFKTDFVKNYSKNLFTWKELADLINVRPLMTQERVHLLDPQKRNFQWYSHGWMKDKNTFPPSLIKLLLEEIGRASCRERVLSCV